MGVTETFTRINLARLKMQHAQKALDEYLKRPDSDAGDGKRFRQLYFRMDVCTHEYLSLVNGYLRRKYHPAAEDLPESKLA